MVIFHSILYYHFVIGLCDGYVFGYVLWIENVLLVL